MEWRSLPAIATWTRFPGPTYRLEGANLHVTSSPTQWGGQLISPPQRLEARSCYVIGFDLNVLRGALGVNAQEKGGQSLNVVRISSFPNPQLHRAEMRFKTESDKPVQIIISGANLAFSVTEFRVSNVGIARCDCALHIGDCTGHKRIDHVADRNILIAGNEVLHVGEYFLQLAQLVSGELPVAGLPGEPKLGVIRLNSSHEFTKARNVAFRKLLGRRRRWRGLLRGIREGLASRGATHRRPPQMFSRVPARGCAGLDRIV